MFLDFWGTYLLINDACTFCGNRSKNNHLQSYVNKSTPENKMTETARSAKQIEVIKSALMKEQWDLFMTLHWRYKDYPVEYGREKLNALDAHLGTAMVGKRFNRRSNFCKRVKWFGTFGTNKQQHLHAHLLMQLPPGADKDSLVALIDEYHKKLQGKDTYSLDITIDDKAARVGYVLKQNHLPYESYFSDTLNLNHIVFSPNYEMPTI